MMEGDLPLRARRRQIARAWRGDAPELLAGASLIVGGTHGLTVVLAGGPRPGRLTMRTVAQGKTGYQIRRSMAASRLPQLDAPELARRLAQHAAATVLLPAILPGELVAEVATVWPRSDA